MINPWTRQAPVAHWSTETTRTCKACGAAKPLDAFRLLGGTWRERTCKSCRHAQDRAQRQGRPRTDPWTEGRRAARRQRQRERRMAQRDPLPPRNWWTVKRAAAHYGKSISCIHVYIKQGLLEARRAEDGYSYRVRPPRVP